MPLWCRAYLLGRIASDTERDNATFIVTTRIVGGPESRKRQGVRPSVRLSVRVVVPARAHGGIPAAAGLLLWARQAEYIDRLLQQRRAIVGSATLSAYTYVAEDRSVTDVVMFRGMCACLCVSVICLRVGNSGDQAMQTRLNRSR